MLEVCAGWACLDSVLSSILSLFFLLSLGDNPIETENCPKEPFNPKQLTSQSFFGFPIG